MNDKITQTVEKYHMLANGDTVLIALSGGADSVFLAEYLLSVKKKYNLKLIAAHVEHGIRGSESLADCEFCEKYCEEKKIPIFVKHINAPAEAKKPHLALKNSVAKRDTAFFIQSNAIKLQLHTAFPIMPKPCFFALQGALRLKAPAQFRRLATKLSARL